MRKDAVIFLVEAAILIAAAIWVAHMDGMQNGRQGGDKSGRGAVGVRPITADEVNRRLKMNEKVVVLDVRTPEEYAAGHIPGSVLLPLEPQDKITAGIGKAVPDKATPIFVYCRSGRRSKTAAALLVKLGYTNVYDLGGINNWPFATEKGA